MKIVYIFCNDCNYKCKAKVKFKKSDSSNYIDAIVSNMNCLNSNVSCNWTRPKIENDDSTVADRLY